MSDYDSCVSNGSEWAASTEDARGKKRKFDVAFHASLLGFDFVDNEDEETKVNLAEGVKDVENDEVADDNKDAENDEDTENDEVADEDEDLENEEEENGPKPFNWNLDSESDYDSNSYKFSWLDNL